jgi:hypothetical protein
MKAGRHIAAHVGASWSLLWRATVLGPFCALAMAAVFFLWLGRFLLPFFIALNLYLRDWVSAAAFIAAWLLAMALWRWRRFQSCLEEPPSLL